MVERKVFPHVPKAERIFGSGKIYIGGKLLPCFAESFRIKESPSLMTLAEKAKLLGAAFSGISGSMTLACNGLTESWCAAAEKKYLEYHRKLPGSNKTKRLRKKRRDVTLRWFHGWLGGLGR